MIVPAILRDQWNTAIRTHPGLGAARERFANQLIQHGDAHRWLDALDAIPALRPSRMDLGNTVTVGVAADAPRETRHRLEELLKSLHPWRKGPFALFAVHVDAEWRSDWKWLRVEPHIAPLSGRRILDVGCGNGYYGWRMCAAGAHSVLGVDPTPLFLMQHAAVSRFVAAVDESIALRNQILPCRLDALEPTEPFDTLFCMGVLYHRRDPLIHLRELHARLRRDGELVLETLIVEDGAAPVLVPDGRYARMRNVWQIPSPEALIAWVGEAGFHGARIVDRTRTRPEEQRSTPWMRFESLAESLDPDDPTRTIEGHPAPVRAVVLASA